MTTIIMIFSFPIGLYFLMQEKKGMKKYQKIFDDFAKKVSEDKQMTQSEKINIFKEMLYTNRYEVTKTTQTSVWAEKKIFSVGWLFIGIGTFYIGLIFYVLYYYFLQKPHVVKFDLCATSEG